MTPHILYGVATGFLVLASILNFLLGCSLFSMLQRMVSESDRRTLERVESLIGIMSEDCPKEQRLTLVYHETGHWYVGRFHATTHGPRFTEEYQKWEQTFDRGTYVCLALPES